MKIVEIAALPNGAHRNQDGGMISVPEGWAVIPEGTELPNFPFGEVTAEEVTHYREIETEQGVVNESYTVMTVTAWTAGELPELEEIEEQPSAVEQLRADVDYIAIMTGVEL